MKKCLPFKEMFLQYLKLNKFNNLIYIFLVLQIFELKYKNIF